VFPTRFSYFYVVEIETLIAENQALKAQNALLLANQEKLQNQLNAVLRLLKIGKSERFISSDNPEQPTLFSLPETQTEEVAEEKQSISYERTKKAKKQHPGREPLPDHLERREEVIEPILDEQAEWEKFGEERSEILECEPGSLYVRVIVRPTYKKKTKWQADESEITTAPLPSRPILGSYAGASILANLMVAKFVDHLPFYRQIQQLKRDYNYELSKSTLNGWFAAVCTLIEPLYQELVEKTKNQDYLQGDESRIPVLTNIAKDKDGKPIKSKRSTKNKATKITRGWVWVIHDPVHKNVVFNYEMGRTNKHACTLLENHEGYLQVDQYAAYKQFLKLPNVIYVACAAHIRRKFFEALKNDKQRAEKGLEFFAAMYDHERIARPMDADARYAYRLEHLQPIIAEFKDWLDQECTQVTPKSKIGKAFTYAQNSYEGLKSILLDGRLELDNNLIENSIRPLALGRKNFLFAGSHEAAQRIAMFYSFFGTCKAQGINPRKWLQKVLEEIPDTSLADLEKLLPGNINLDD